MPNSNMLKEAYATMLNRFGPQDWWPGDTPFEVMVGAILTQNTNWLNVEKAINNLKKASVLSPVLINKIDHDSLAELIRPAGYYNIKSKRLKNFVSKFIEDFEGSVAKLSELNLQDAREWLLSINGIGLETADSILLYALDKPIFVIDAYTKRIFERHNFVDRDIDYLGLQEIFMDDLEEDVKLFNEYHALIVRVGKDFCKKTPKCDECPLQNWNR